MPSPSEIVNKSFSLTQKDMDEMLEFIVYEKRLNSPDDVKYFQKYIYEKTIGDFQQRDEYGTANGFDNFPDDVELFRIIDKKESEINKNKPGLSWTYNPQKLTDRLFISNIGFQGSPDEWTVAKAIFRKEDIEIGRTYQMLIANWVEDEINVKENSVPKHLVFIPYTQFAECKSH